LTVQEKISLFPHSPGVYRYYDSQGNVIYVGKAKDLHNRVAQYFVDPSRLTLKTAHLVRHIADAEYTVVGSEAEALLLENNLIKQYKPKYNILLKDSKTYPWICVTGDTFPKVFLTRKITRGDGSRYFGPYSSVVHARNLLEFINDTYKLRDCKLKITAEGVMRHKFRPCLNIQIGKCPGCCVGRISVEEYNKDIEEIIALLKGGARDVIKHYQTLMKEAAERLEFEQAAVYKAKVDSLAGHYSKSVITSSTLGSLDVFTLVLDSGEAFGNFLRVKDGSIIQSLNLGFKLHLEETQEEVLSFFIGEIESKFGLLSREILVPFMPDVEIPGVEFKIPARGDKLTLLELSMRNSKEMRVNALLQREHTDPDRYKNMVMESLQKQLGMKELPVHIECFDNSNIQGTNPVSSCVVFRNAVPSKKDYRHFKVKTVVGANDYETMKEAVNRRFSRMLHESPEDLPQLVVIDGGKGQLAFAHQALSELGLSEKFTLVALAERMEEVYRVGDPHPLFIDRNSPALKLLQQIRDEAHRFGITFHRDLRSKAQVKSALSSIKGVGAKTEERLLSHFGSVKRIIEAKEEDIAALVGPALAKRILSELLPK
jgi:excinuclease ABC subunit C